jgi:hypothetical protein
MASIQGGVSLEGDIEVVILSPKRRLEQTGAVDGRFASLAGGGLRHFSESGGLQR